jgi:hypothetical protein
MIRSTQKDTELPRMTSQEMIKDSVAQSIRQEIFKNIHFYVGR